LDITAANFGDYFNEQSTGVAIQLGGVSGGVTDVDLDCSEALALAKDFDFFLPPTQAIFGRRSKPRSHYFFKTRLCDSSSKAALPFKDVDGKMLVELRIGAGDKGAVTLCPPSEHPSGEIVTWAEEGDPAVVDGEDLIRRVKILAAASLLVRHYPVEGGRHEAMLPLGGVLARAQWSEEQIAQFVEALATVAGDEQCAERITTATGAVAHLASGGDTPGLPRMRESWTPDVADLFAKWLELDAGVKSPGQTKGTKADNQTRQLIGLAEEAELFHSREGISFADVMVDGHRETLLIKNSNNGLGAWLRHRYYEETGGAPTSEAMRGALSTLEAKARYDGPVHEVHLRVAPVDDKVYLDLGDEDWHVVEIDAEGWRLVADPAVRFLRRKGMLPLPMPVRMTNVAMRRRAIEKLSDYVNVATEEDFCLFVSYLLVALRGRGPFPVLELLGEPGTAKSTLLRMVKSLVDPNKAPLRTPPRDSRDMFVAANSSYLVAYDNLSDLKDWLSDMLCRLSTGGGFGARQLYTDDEEMLFDAIRPVALTAVDNVVARSDLADRSIFLTLTAIPDEERRREQELWSAFERDRPAILGALLDTVAHGLRELPNTRLTGHPRMADFAEWASACEGALWDQRIFGRAYASNRAKATASVIEEDLVADAVASYMARRQRWEGETRELLQNLNGAVDDATKDNKSWPKAANALARRMNRIAGMLRSNGIVITSAPVANRSGWKITNKNWTDDAPEADQDDDYDDGDAE